MPNLKTPLNILIIEDNEGDVLLLTEVLKSSSLKIERLLYAKDLASGFDIIRNNTIDLILLDLTLPGSKELDTFNALQNFTQQIPVIILTGLADTRLALEAINSGAQDYLLKGEIDENLLNKTILYSIERKRISESLRLSNERYNLVSRATNDMVWDWDLVKDKIFRNSEGWVKIFGSLPDNTVFSVTGWTDRIHPDDRERVDKAIRRVIDNNALENFEIEYRVRKADDTYLHIIDRGYLIRDDHGKAIRMIGAMQNITEKKLAEEELKRLSLIAKETLNAVIVTDISGKITWVNQAFINISGYSLEESLGRKPGDMLQGPETNPIMKRFMRQKIKRVEQFECDILNYSKDGKKYWIRIQCQPQFDERGKLANFFAMQTDITKEKEAVDLVRSSEEKYRNLFNNNPASIFIWNPANLAILEVNEAAIQEYGYSREEFLQMQVTDLNAAGSGDEIKDLAINLMVNENFKSNAVWQHVTRTGAGRYMDITFQAIDYYGQKASLAIANNITGQIELEVKLSTERLKRQQEITAAVITAQEQEREELGKELHDNINQILATTRLYIEYAQTNEGKRDELLNSAKDFIMSAVNGIRDLSKSLSPPSLGEVGLIVALEELFDSIREVRKYTFHTDWKDVDEDMVSEKLRLTIFRIVQEQLNNIMKHAKAKNVWVKIKLQNQRLLISVKDDGKGFNMIDKSKGVGLKNISSRAGLHNGTMQMQSEPGKGCELKVSFSL